VSTKDATVVARSVAKYVPMSSTKVTRLTSAFTNAKVSVVLSGLSALPHRAARVLEKLIMSAAANAVVDGIRDADSLMVTKLSANGGPMRKRIRAKSRGMAYVERNRTSHIWCELSRPN